MGKLKSISALLLTGSILLIGCGYSAVPVKEETENTSGTTEGELDDMQKKAAPFGAARFNPYRAVVWP